MKNLTTIATVLIAYFVMTLTALTAENEGWFGFSAKVDASKFSFNPVIRSIVIAKVTPDSPAAEGGLNPGDRIIRIEGVFIEGKRAKEVRPLLDKVVGESLDMELGRPDGEVYSATLIAQLKPKEQD